MDPGALDPGLVLLKELVCLWALTLPQPQPALTLDDGQQDDDDKEEEGDVKHYPVQLIFITCWVLNLVPDAPTSSDTHVHVKQITLWVEGEKHIGHTYDHLTFTMYL